MFTQRAYKSSPKPAPKPFQRRHNRVGQRAGERAGVECECQSSPDGAAVVSDGQVVVIGEGDVAEEPGGKMRRPMNIKKKTEGTAKKKARSLFSEGVLAIPVSQRHVARSLDIYVYISRTQEDKPSSDEGKHTRLRVSS